MHCPIFIYHLQSFSLNFNFIVVTYLSTKRNMSKRKATGYLLSCNVLYIAYYKLYNISIVVRPTVGKVIFLIAQDKILKKAKCDDINTYSILSVDTRFSYRTQ